MDVAWPIFICILLQKFLTENYIQKTFKIHNEIVPN